MENFTKRELEVLYQLFLAKENKEISKNLCISEHTTKAHLASIYKKLGVSNRMQAILKCFRALTQQQIKQQDLEKIFNNKE